jgi:hypothetical protein
MITRCSDGNRGVRHGPLRLRWKREGERNSFRMWREELDRNVDCFCLEGMTPARTYSTDDI